MDRVVNVKAVDENGSLLAGAKFKFSVNGRPFGSTKEGDGFAVLHLSGPKRDQAKARIEVSATYCGKTKKLRLAPSADSASIAFDLASQPPEPPPVRDREDPQRGRWGGSEASGRSLKAELIQCWKGEFQFDLIIESTDGTPLQPPARFHLHPEYEKPIQLIKKVKHAGTRIVWEQVSAREAYVVGAQVRDGKGRWIGLEFDLNTLALPDSLKDDDWLKANKLQAGEVKKLAKFLAQFERPDLIALWRRFRPATGDPRLPPTPIKLAFLIAETANKESWWRQLVNAIRVERPDDAALSAFAEDLGLSLPAYSNGHRVKGEALDAIMQAANPMHQPALFRARMANIEEQVCRLECPAGQPRGTAFLIGPDTVMTNYHVVRRLIPGEVAEIDRWNPADVVLRFDYKFAPDGLQLGAGLSATLSAEDWLIDWSPYCDHDLGVQDAPQPQPDQLDYAILRLSRAIGSLPVSEGISGSPQRGWVRVPRAAEMPDYATKKALFIVQHPAGEPLQLALDTNSIIKVAGNGTRLQYNTNTKPGSSGSPCFGDGWQWIALHHGRDPQYDVQYNQGILVPAILALLEQRNKRWAVAS